MKPQHQIGEFNHVTSQHRANGVPIDKRTIAQTLKSAKTANLHIFERDEGIRKLIKDYYLESLSNTDQNLIQMDIASSEEEDEQQDDATTTTTNLAEVPPSRDLHLNVALDRQKKAQTFK